MNHVIIGDGSKADIYQEYLESTGDTVVRSLSVPPPSAAVRPFNLGFICNETVSESIKVLAPHCKVLVTPKLDTFKQWSDERDAYPACQFVMAKPDIYRPQIETLRGIKFMRNIVHNIEICWDNIIGLIHIAHIVIGPLSNPTIHNDTMTFENFGINVHCEESDHNEIRINYLDNSYTTHSFTVHSVVAEHNMIQDLFALKKFNPGEYHKHFILDRFVHLLLE